MPDLIAHGYFLMIIIQKEKKERKDLEEKDHLLKSKAALNIKLLPESSYDTEIAQLLRLEAPMSKFRGSSLMPRPQTMQTVT